MRTLEAFVDTLYPDHVPRQQSYLWMDRLQKSGLFKPAWFLPGIGGHSGVGGLASEGTATESSSEPWKWIQNTTDVLAIEAACQRITSLSVVASRPPAEREMVRK